MYNMIKYTKKSVEKKEKKRKKRKELKRGKKVKREMEIVQESERELSSSDVSGAKRASSSQGE